MDMQDDAPTRTYFGPYGPKKVIWEDSEGRPHRSNGLPAIIVYDDRRQIVDRYWYKHGVEYFPQFGNQCTKCAEEAGKTTIDDCPICNMPRKFRVAYGCTHATVCVRCDIGLEKCPICDEHIVIRIKILQ